MENNNKWKKEMNEMRNKIDKSYEEEMSEIGLTRTIFENKLKR